MKLKTHKTMAYIPIGWPEIQHYMELPGFDENAYLINDEQGMEDFGSSAYFVDEDWLNDLPNEDDDDFDHPDRQFVNDIVTWAFEEFDDEQDFEFNEPLRLSNGFTATGFYTDSRVWDVRVITKSDNGNQVDILLSEFIPLEEAKEMARRISFGEYTCVGVTLFEKEEPDGSKVEMPWSYGKHFD